MTLKSIKPEVFADMSKPLERIEIRRPMLHLSGAEIVKLHAQGTPVPMTEYTVVVPVKSAP